MATDPTANPALPSYVHLLLTAGYGVRYVTDIGEPYVPTAEDLQREAAWDESRSAEDKQKGTTTLTLGKRYWDEYTPQRVASEYRVR